MPPSPEEIERRRKAAEEASKREKLEELRRYPQPDTDLYNPNKSTDTRTDTRTQQSNRR